MSFDAKNLKVGDRAVMSFYGLSGHLAHIVTAIKSVDQNIVGETCYRIDPHPPGNAGPRFHYSWFKPFDPKDIPIGSEVYLDFRPEGVYPVKVVRRYESNDHRSGVAYEVEPVPLPLREFGNGFDSSLLLLNPPDGVEPADPDAEIARFYLLDAEDGVLTFGGLGGYVDDEVAFFEDEDEAKDHAEQYALAHPDRDIAVLRSIGSYRATSAATFTPAG